MPCQGHGLHIQLPCRQEGTSGSQEPFQLCPLPDTLHVCTTWQHIPDSQQRGCIETDKFTLEHVSFSVCVRGLAMSGCKLCNDHWQVLLVHVLHAPAVALSTRLPADLSRKKWG